MYVLNEVLSLNAQEFDGYGWGVVLAGVSSMKS